MKFEDFTVKDQISEIIERSTEISCGVVIFKHSTRCAISSMALKRFTRGWKIDAGKMPVYYLDVIRHREISNTVSEDFATQHESPQVLLIKNGRCVYHTSHNGISPQRVAEEAQDV